MQCPKMLGYNYAKWPLQRTEVALVDPYLRGSWCVGKEGGRQREPLVLKIFSEIVPTFVIEACEAVFHAMAMYFYPFQGTKLCLD